MGFPTPHWLDGLTHDFIEEGGSATENQRESEEGVCVGSALSLLKANLLLHHIIGFSVMGGIEVPPFVYPIQVGYLGGSCAIY